MNQRLLFTTYSGTQYWLIQAGLYGPWTLLFMSGPDGKKEFPTLEKALFTLGGMVPWDHWSDKARYDLQALNNGKAI
jgi:hypothetical protein